MLGTQEETTEAFDESERQTSRDSARYASKSAQNTDHERAEQEV